MGSWQEGVGCDAEGLDASMEAGIGNMTFWAKTTPEGSPGVTVTEHMRNVGYVALALAERYAPFIRAVNLDITQVAAVAALHDVGKISPGFQRKCAAWLQQHGLERVSAVNRWEYCEADHGKTSRDLLQRFLTEIDADETTSSYLSAVIGGHHGRLKLPNHRGPRKSGTDDRSGIRWEEHQRNAFEEICALFNADLRTVTLAENSPAYWFVGGLTSVADWIGSDERYFSVDGGMADGESHNAARRAVDEIGISGGAFAKGLSFDGLFGFSPNSLQTAAMGSIGRPGVYVIEAPMGMGKTEAALAAAYGLMQQGLASGIYFALPTQATSNRMHIRMKRFIDRVAQGGGPVRLIHGNSWLIEKTGDLKPVPTAPGEMEDATDGFDWFCSSKRAILAPFGVGTVDQALLGVVAAKHFFVRHFALAGKVVVLDEIHSYDVYTGVLVNKLVEALRGLGCTVIILSATLTGRRRAELLSGRDPGSVDSGTDPFPLISGYSWEDAAVRVAVEPPESKIVETGFVDQTDAERRALSAASEGGCVVWVCNTVDQAQETYRRFAAAGGDIVAGLLHARFPFWRREEIESEWLERLGKESATRCGSILVSTQIVEQSVDIDADLLITELAPTDLMLQRMGRLWRHKRSRPSGMRPQMLIISEECSLDEFEAMGKEQIKKALGAKAHVYDPFVLLRTLTIWTTLKSIILPEDIRGLISATYDEPDGDLPEAWMKLEEELHGGAYAKKLKAVLNSSLWLPPEEDREGVQTRLNERPECTLVLCREIGRDSLELIDGSVADCSGEPRLPETARAIHRNSVRIPWYLVETGYAAHASVGRYVHGACVLGRVEQDGAVHILNARPSVGFRWDGGEGVVIEHRGKERQ